jgi:hypothetical protein
MPDNSWLPWVAVLVSGLCGGLAGAILTQWVQKRTKWIERPILLAGFGKEGDGSIILQDSPASDADSSTKVVQQWLRVKIKNNGKSTARNVRVLIVSIVNRTSDFTEWKFAREIIDCGWSHVDETKMDIPPATWRFADLFALEMSNTKSDVKITGKGARNIPSRIEVISITIKIMADNCETTTVSLPLQYQGLQKGMKFTEQVELDLDM